MGPGDTIWHLPFNKLIKPPTARKLPGVMNPPHCTIIQSELILLVYNTSVCLSHMPAENYIFHEYRIS